MLEAEFCEATSKEYMQMTRCMIMKKDPVKPNTVWYMTTWMPNQFAILDKRIRIRKTVDDSWDAGWTVIAVYETELREVKPDDQR